METRASFDLSLYHPSGDDLLNVEFKSGGVSLKAKSKSRIWKDIEKLIKDPGDGMWFHLLKAVNNSTINNVLGTLNRDLTDLFKYVDTTENSKQLIIHICVLQHTFSLHKVLDLKEPKFQNGNFANFFNFEYWVSHDNLKKIVLNNGWDCLTQS